MIEMLETTEEEFPEVKTLEYELTDRQDKAWDALDDPDVTDTLYGGAKGGGKSFFICIWIYAFALWIIEKFSIEPSSNPIHIGWFGRKQAVDFKGTTLATWRKIIPTDMYEIKGGSDKEVPHILIDGRVAIDYGGLDSAKAVEKFNSAEYAFVCVDQAEETSRDDVSVLTGSLRLKINGEELPYNALYSANPRQCWLKNDFILNPEKSFRFIQALPSDNPHLPSTYIKRLKISFGHRKELLEAYLNGSWDAFEGADQIILGRWLAEAKQRRADVPFIKTYLVCDTARFGDDTTVIHLMENADITKTWKMPKTSAPDIVVKLTQLSIENDDCQIVVEVVGADLGAAVYDYLVKGGREVIAFKPAAASTKQVVMGTNTKGKPIMRKLYQNLRAEAWIEGGKKLQRGILDEEHGIPLCCPGMYEKLENHLITPTYKWNEKSGLMQVEAKEDIKKPERLGESPDDGDCYIISLWAWDKIDKLEDRLAAKIQRRRRGYRAEEPEVSAMAG